MRRAVVRRPRLSKGKMAEHVWLKPSARPSDLRGIDSTPYLKLRNAILLPTDSATQSLLLKRFGG
jgi:hypothetical protein